MRRLIELGNEAHAAELVRRLNDASLTAVYAPVPPLHETAHVTMLEVWIGEDDDVAVAARVVNEFRAELVASMGSLCAGCGYDLRGHTGEGQCPECGWRFMLGERAALEENPEDADVLCASCGEEVPANFECCWNCGREMRSAEPCSD